MCKAILSNDVKPAFKGAALIGQRMNRETYQEVRGYLDAFFGPEAVEPIDIAELTHFGQPYDGARRYFSSDRVSSRQYVPHSAKHHSSTVWMQCPQKTV